MQLRLCGEDPGGACAKRVRPPIAFVSAQLPSHPSAEHPVVECSLEALQQQAAVPGFDIVHAWQLVSFRAEAGAAAHRMMDLAVCTWCGALAIFLLCAAGVNQLHPPRP